MRLKFIVLKGIRNPRILPKKNPVGMELGRRLCPVLEFYRKQTLVKDQLPKCHERFFAN